MSLKPKLTTYIALILGGVILTLSGFGAWIATGCEMFFPLMFGIAGLLWLCIGCLTLKRRNSLTIIITESGIEIPAFHVFQKGSPRIFIGREDIARISKHESLKGRLIEITTHRGDSVRIPALNYCELDKFLSHCKSHGLPVA